MKTRGTKTVAKRINPVLLIGVLMIVSAVLALPVYSVKARLGSSSPKTAEPAPVVETSSTRATRWLSAMNTSLTNPLVPFTPAIAIFEADCTTPSTSFSLGDTVCAKITGANLPGADGRTQARIGWVSPYGSLAQGGDITTDPQTGTYAIPATAFQTFTDSGGGTVTVDNRGTWTLGIYSGVDASLITSAPFTVHDPAVPSVNLNVHQSLTPETTQVPAGSNGLFQIFVNNFGPDTAQAVVLNDNVPSNTTFVSFSQTSGPAFTCTTPAEGATGAINCTLATLAADDAASFVFIYKVNEGTAAGTVISNTATIASTTVEAVPADNSSTQDVTVPTGGGSPNCTLNCPESISKTADTTDQGNPGAIVHFDPPSGEAACGNISVSHCNDCFFPVGTTVVTATADSGDTCSFSVTVNPSGSATITCPSNQTANAGNDCEASVSIGTATATGTFVTVFGSRSDGKPMYTCDVFGNCTRNSSDAPFSAGTTTITWIAYSHDVAGPYTGPVDVNGNPANPADTEEAHRTGSDSCTQTVIVNDVTAPVIAATDQTVSADANCQAAVPDYSSTVSDNCACSNSDTSEDCQGHPHFTVTQTPAAGTLVGLGPHTVHIEANDNSSNNGGAGNVSTKDVTFTVNDTTAPTVTAPADSSASADANCQAPVPNYAASSTASDSCDSSLTLTQSPAPGTLVGLGPHTVTVSTTDDSGNTGSDTVIFTVNDITAPAIICPANITTGTDPNSCSATVNPGTPSASDNCGSPTVIGVRSDGQALNAPYPKGTTTITWTATDGSGNHSSCNQTVTVNDTQPPAITCQADIIADYDPAVNGAVVTYTAPIGTDNCPGATTVRTAGPASGSTFPLGTTVVTFKVTDGVGLTAECSFKVTVAVTSVIGLDSASLTGNSLLDSYDSTGGYPATKGSLAKLLSNGTVTISGSSKVFGNVRSTRVGVSVLGTSQVNGNATAGTTVTKATSAVITGTITNNALAPVMTLPSVPACGPPYSSNSGITGTYSYNSSTGDLTLSGINIATLANGTYCFHNVSLSNSAQLKVNGPVVIRLTGTLTTGGATSLPNTTLIPKNLQILSSYSGANGVTFGNSAGLQLVVYAPQTAVSITGSAPLFGTVVGKSVTVSNSGMIHYDTQLKTIWPGIWTLIFGP